MTTTRKADPRQAGFALSRCPDGGPHHFQIEIAEGKESLGRCQKCGGVKVFQNQSPDLPWASWGGWETAR